MSHRMTIVTCQQGVMAVTVDELKTALGCDTDIALAERLGVERSTIAQWRRRAGVPQGWHYVLKLKDVEIQSLAARRRLFGDGDGYYVQMAALALMDAIHFDWPGVGARGQGYLIQEWIIKTAAYVIQVLDGRTCNSYLEYEDLFSELSRPEHREGLRQWLYPAGPQ